MAERIFALPDLGEGLEEAEIGAWLVREGQTVALNQPLVEVETAKATVEVPSPRAGTVTRLHAGVGETVRVGAPLVTFDETDAGPPSPDPSSREGTDAAPTAEGAPPSARAGGPTPATPAVRRLARELGVELSELTGTGPGARVTREDVERAAASSGATGPASDQVQIVPVSAVRRAIAENLTRVVREVPQVTTFRTLDCTALEAFRRELGVSPLPVVAAALVRVCRDHPSLNASFRADAGQIHLFRRVHLGIATDTERGLVVPVIRDAGSRTIGALAAEIGRLAALAREGRLAPSDTAGGTITITNTGSYGSEWGTPILTPGQGAILALGVIEPRALAVDGRVEVRAACTLSLTFDHRLLDGAGVGRAFGDLVTLLSGPERLRELPR